MRDTAGDAYCHEQSQALSKILWEDHPNYTKMTDAENAEWSKELDAAMSHPLDWFGWIPRVSNKAIVILFIIATAILIYAWSIYPEGWAVH